MIAVDFSFDMVDYLLIFRTEENFGVGLFLLKGIEVGFWHFFFPNSFELDAFLKNLAKVHIILCQKSQTFPLGEHYFVEALFGTCRDVEVVGFGEILASFEVEEGDAELEEIEVEGSLFDALVELAMVGVESLDVGGLGD